MTTTTENVKPSLSEQGAWLLAARIVGFVFSIALPLLLVRRLDQSEFGVYKQAFLVVIFLSNVLPLGFQMSAFYFLPREDAKGRAQTVCNILLFNLLVGLTAFLTLSFAPQILGSVFQSEVLARLSPVIGLVVCLWIFSTFLETVAVANQEPQIGGAFIMLAQLTKTALLFAAGAIFGTVDSLVYAALAQTILQTIILVIYLTRRFPRFWLAFSPASFGRQVVYALPFGFAGLFYALQYDLHNFFVSHNFSPAEFAIYATGCFQLPLVGMLGEAVSSVMIPRMSELESQNRPRQMIELAAIAVERLALAYFPLYVFLMLTAQQFVTALFTANYAASVPIFKINLTLLPFGIVALDSIIRAHADLGRFLLKLRIVIFVALAALLWFGVKNFDLRGMILIVIGITLLERTITTWRVWHKLGVQVADLKLFKNVVKIGLSAIVAGVPTFAVNWLLRDAAPLVNLIVCGIVFAPVYLAAIYFSNSIPDEELQRFYSFAGSFLQKFRKTKTQTISNEA